MLNFEDLLRAKLDELKTSVDERDENMGNRIE